MDRGKAVAVYIDQLDSHAISLGLDVPFGCAVLSNRFIEEQKPWKMAKASNSKESLLGTLYTLAESLRIIAILISPVLPRAAHGIFDQLNWKMELSGKEERFSLADAEWGKLPDGHVVGKPVPLFPRIEANT
jgi:methionyl-tRNA synthetase